MRTGSIPLKHRPIASGIAGERSATVCLLAAPALAAHSSGRSSASLPPICSSWRSTRPVSPYRHRLTIAIGFVLRAAAGAVAIDVAISHWLYVLTILLALFLALSKRRHELVLLGEGATGHRRILEEYSPYLLDQMISVVTASTLVAYAFYTVSPETVSKFGTDLLGLTLPLPIYGIFRYLYLVHQKEGGGSPAEMLLTDRPLLICSALWAVAVAIIIYGPNIWG